MSKHTPGPWEVSLTTETSSPSVRKVGRLNPSICGFGHVETTWVKTGPLSTGIALTEKGKEEQALYLADAQLIAAAPEMLEALKDVVGALQFDNEWCGLAAKVQRVIAKAEGK